jgi:hypothetical protein
MAIPSRSIGRQRSVVCIRGFARGENHVSRCSWKSSSLADARPGSKDRSMKSCKLDDALGLRVRRLAEVPVDAQLSAERRVFLRGATLAGVQPGLAIPDQQLRKRAPSDVKISAPAPARE